MLDFQLRYWHLNEIQRLASLVRHLNEDDLTVVPHNRTNSTRRPVAKCFAEPHDIMFDDHMRNSHRPSLALDIGGHKTRRIILKSELPRRRDHDNTLRVGA